MNMWDEIKPYRETFERFLKETGIPGNPENLYAPVRYILNLGGKRIRPVLTLIAAEGYGKKPELSLPAAAALEIFHNFTLVHDDIMDRAPLRRGHPTVHTRWNLPVAVLSGDVMIFLAQQFLEKYPPEIFKALQSAFNRAAVEICEGQQMDMDFESREEIATEEYFEMIRKKTAVLLGTALQYGAVLGEKNRDEQQLLYEAGIRLGLAFQIIDDYLDTFGDENFGKAVGGDIREGKKTFLYVKAVEKLTGENKKRFIELYNKKDKTPDEVEKIKKFFIDFNIPQIVFPVIHTLTGEFNSLINSSKLAPGHKKLLLRFSEILANRTL